MAHTWQPIVGRLSIIIIIIIIVGRLSIIIIIIIILGRLSIIIIIIIIVGRLSIPIRDQKAEATIRFEWSHVVSIYLPSIISSYPSTACYHLPTTRLKTRPPATYYMFSTIFFFTAAAKTPGPSSSILRFHPRLPSATASVTCFARTKDATPTTAVSFHRLDWPASRDA